MPAFKPSSTMFVIMPLADSILQKHPTYTAILGVLSIAIYNLPNSVIMIWTSNNYGESPNYLKNKKV